jgi:hypothetical protein
MKKIIISIAAVLCCSALFAVGPQQKTPKIPMLKGCISSNSLEDIPPFNIYFNGGTTQNDENGMFSFQLDASPEDQYYMLVCKSFEPKFSGPNTINYLSVNDKTPYKFFVFAKNQKTGIWSASERKLAGLTKSVPNNCIIVSMPPSRIEKLEPWSFEFESHFAAMPKILLKENLETKNVPKAKSIARSSIKSELDSISSKKIFHTKSLLVKQNNAMNPDVVVSLPE